MYNNMLAKVVRARRLLGVAPYGAVGWRPAALHYGALRRYQWRHIGRVTEHAAAIGCTRQNTWVWTQKHCVELY